MNKLISVIFFAIFFCSQTVMADGVNNVESSLSVEDTANKLEKILVSKGMTIFNRINHGEAAEKVGIELRDTQLIIFGNPKIGSLLMKCQQAIAIDLPQKALVWKDEANKVWISYNDPSFLQTRHSVAGCDKVFGKISGALANISKAAATQ